MTFLFHDHRQLKTKVTFLQIFDIYRCIWVATNLLSTTEYIGEKFNRSAVAFECWVRKIVLLKIISPYLHLTGDKNILQFASIAVWQTHCNSKYGALWVIITTYFKILYILLLFLSCLCACQKNHYMWRFYGLSVGGVSEFIASTKAIDWKVCSADTHAYKMLSN